METFKKEHKGLSGDSKEGKHPEIPHEENREKKEASLEKRSDPGIGKRNGKNDKRWDFESPENPVDKKTAKWIEEQNEFLGKQKEKEFEKDKKERDPPSIQSKGSCQSLTEAKSYPPYWL